MTVLQIYQKEYSKYIKQYPNAQDPLEYVGMIGLPKLVQILQQRKNKSVYFFTTHRNLKDYIAFHYV